MGKKITRFSLVWILTYLLLFFIYWKNPYFLYFVIDCSSWDQTKHQFISITIAWRKSAELPLCCADAFSLNKQNTALHCSHCASLNSTALSELLQGCWHWVTSALSADKGVKHRLVSEDVQLLERFGLESSYSFLLNRTNKWENTEMQ